jgi:hypothetical protein
MDYIAFPLRIEKTGQLARASGVEENLLSLLRLMLTTPAAGWAGSPNFGMRDMLPQQQSNQGTRLTLIKQMNQTLLDFAIDWVSVYNFEIESPDALGKIFYILTLSYKGKGVEVYRV